MTVITPLNAISPVKNQALNNQKGHSRSLPTELQAEHQVPEKPAKPEKSQAGYYVSAGLWSNKLSFAANMGIWITSMLVSFPVGMLADGIIPSTSLDRLIGRYATWFGLRYILTQAVEKQFAK